MEGRLGIRSRIKLWRTETQVAQGGLCERNSQILRHSGIDWAWGALNVAQRKADHPGGIGSQNLFMRPEQEGSEENLKIRTKHVENLEID